MKILLILLLGILIYSFIGALSYRFMEYLFYKYGEHQDKPLILLISVFWIISMPFILTSILGYEIAQLAYKLVLKIFPKKY